jgi:hypothetical protein
MRTQTVRGYKRSRSAPSAAYIQTHLRLVSEVGSVQRAMDEWAAEFPLLVAEDIDLHRIIESACSDAPVVTLW